MSDSPRCVKCSHPEDDHDGYGGMCDGLGYNESRTVCGCQQFVAPALSEGEPTPDALLDLLDELQNAAKDFDHHCCQRGNCPHENREVAARIAVLEHVYLRGQPVSPSLSTSSPEPELEKLLDELCLCVGQFEKVSCDWLIQEAETYQMENAQKAVNAARSAIELSFATLTEEIKRLREENTEARQILVEAVDRDISVKDTLRALASVASNGIFWRDKSIASLREELSEWLDRWNAREREVSVIRRSALTEYEARTLLIYLDAKHAGKPLPQGDDLVEFGKSADAKLRLISETPK